MENIDGEDARFEPRNDSSGKGISPDEDGAKTGQPVEGSDQTQDCNLPLATSVEPDVEDLPAKEDNEDLIEPIRFADLPKQLDADLVKAKPRKAGRQGDFFVVDRGVIAYISDHARHQTELAAFCALATCTDATNSLTRAGVNCLCTYLGFSRQVASTAIESLETMGVLERLSLKEVRDPTKNRFRIRSNAEIRGVSSAVAPDPDADIFLPNLLARAKEGRSPLARLLSTGLPGSAATLIQLYVELDFKGFSGISPKILTSEIEKSEPVKIGNYQITQLGRPAILDGTMPQTGQLGDHFRDLKDKPAVLESLRLEGLLSWVIWMGHGALLSNFVGFPIAAFGRNGADLAAVETAVGLSHHLLAMLITGPGRNWGELGELQTSFLNASMLSHVAFGVSADLKAAATVKLHHSPSSIRGLSAEHVLRKQCRDLVQDVVVLVEQDFPSASGLARQLLQAFERKG